MGPLASQIWSRLCHGFLGNPDNPWHDMLTGCILMDLWIGCMMMISFFSFTKHAFAQKIHCPTLQVYVGLNIGSAKTPAHEREVRFKTVKTFVEDFSWSLCSESLNDCDATVLLSFSWQEDHQLVTKLNGWIFRIEFATCTISNGTILMLCCKCCPNLV
jgi:uncharacterized membrane protein